LGSWGGAFETVTQRFDQTMIVINVNFRADDKTGIKRQDARLAG
jgi:hypothetical protein